MLQFVNKTAIITGAGGGIGREYALELARRGCRVIVNDLGGAVSGESLQNNDAAGKVVKEITDKGGKAVANYSNVTNGHEIVEAALKEFGSCDILINNAGILRDKSFGKLAKADWKAVLDVHLEGTFNMCHAVWPHMQANGFGRIINVGSGAGLYGNFGQSNYASAKMGILGLTNTLAIEGEKHNIRVNCVVPVAASRMTENVIPPAMLKLLEPKHIVPLVTYLAHESSLHTGECFEAGGGWYSKVRLQRSGGRSLGSNEQPASVEDIASNIESISQFDDNRVTYPTTPADAIRDMLLTLEYEKNKGSGAITSDATKSQSSHNDIDASSKAPLQSDKLFNALQSLDKSRAIELAGKIRAKVLFEISSNDNGFTKHWLLDLKSADNPSIQQMNKQNAYDAKPNVTLICSDKTFISLSTGSSSPEFAYMRGALKIKGQMGVAMKVKTLLEVAAGIMKS